MNINHHVGNRLQYDFYLNTIRKGKRFAKWAKSSKPNDIEVVKEFYSYSNEKAIQVLSLLSDDQLSELKEKVNRGGKSK
jgi:nitrogen regulatory protein PII-like uncharacterized protein